MDPDLEALIARAENPRNIPLISNYCDRRCARCRFNDRCSAYWEDRLESAAGPRDATASAEHNLERATALIEAYSEQHGINLAAIAGDPGIQDQMEWEMEPCEAERQNPMQVVACEYATLAWMITRSLEMSDALVSASAAVRDAVDTIAWSCTMIAPKVGRAMRSNATTAEDTDPVQNDSNGSAKIARLIIAESLAAWRTLNDEGNAPAGALSRRAATMLEQVDADLGTRFPRAMEFIRPGFDETKPGTVSPWGGRYGVSERTRPEANRNGPLLRVWRRVRRSLSGLIA